MKQWNSLASQKRLKRPFDEGFTAMDAAEPMASFHVEHPAKAVRTFLEQKDFDLVGVRQNGVICGYAVSKELGDGALCDYLHLFTSDDLIEETESLRNVIQIPSKSGRCFVKIPGEVGAIITLNDIEKPPVRMFLFGMITIFEMTMTRDIRMYFPEQSWCEHTSPGSLVAFPVLGGIHPDYRPVA